MKIMTIKETATVLKCSVSTIRSLVKKNEIPHFRVGAKLYFNVASLKKWIREKEGKENENK